MKKLFSLMFVMLFLLCSCTVQAEMNPEIFVSRFSEKYPDCKLETEGMFYEGNKSVLFANDETQNRFALEITTDSSERVQKISLACSGADKAESLFVFAEKVLSVYAPEEDINAVLHNLADGKYFSYYETLWYGYAFSQTESGAFFSVENKRFAPERESVLTLKENESVS